MKYRIAEVGMDDPSVSDMDRLRAYLPANYAAALVVGPTGLGHALIVGYDRAGWTLDDYVIPRLASGLIAATEVTA